MNAQEIQVYKVQLIAKEADLLGKLNALLQPAEVVPAKDSAERAEHVISNEARQTQATSYQLQLANTRKKLKLIEKGTFGICMECGEEVSDARLKADAADASICVPCADKEDREGVSQIRRRERGRRVARLQNTALHTGPYDRIRSSSTSHR